MNELNALYIIPISLVLFAIVAIFLKRKRPTIEEQSAPAPSIKRTVDIDPTSEPVPSSIFDMTPSGNKIRKIARIGLISPNALVRNNACYDGQLTDEQLRALTKALDAGVRGNPCINDLDTIWRDAPKSSNPLRSKSGTQPTAVGHGVTSKNGTNGTTH